MAKCAKCGSKSVFLRLNGDRLCSQCADAHIHDLEVEKVGLELSIEDIQEEVKRITSELDQKNLAHENLLAAHSALEASITPEMKDAFKLKQLQSDVASSLHDMEQMIKDINDLTEKKQAELAAIQKNILVAEDTVELEAFALYEPKYPLMHVSELKDRMINIRDDQKRMIKAGVAASGSTTWTVNGSAAEGKKMTKDMVKLCLRSFNNECDMAISQVRFNTYERCSERIKKAYESINKLGQVTHVSISELYRNSKLLELSVVLEYALAKEREKEELRALREEERERKKLEKELEEARRAADKERRHYEQALNAIDAKIAVCVSDDEKADLENKRSELVSGIDQVDAKIADIDYRETNQKAGYVYIISNIGSFGAGIYKIGMTRRLDPSERVSELGDASVPFYFDVHAMIFSNDAPQLEAALHKAFEHRRLNKVNTRREYFRVSLDEIKEEVRKNFDKTVEFIEVPVAEQYRESLLME